MKIEEIKKELYKQKPRAILLKVQQSKLHYGTSVFKNDGLKYLFFEVPFSELGEASWDSTIEAKHLIRYLVTPEK